MGAFHNVFHVSQVRKCLSNQDIFIPEIPSDLGTILTLETRMVRIVDRMEKSMRRKTIQMVKLVWDCSGQEQVTWETEARMKADFREWYGQFSMEASLGSDSGTNPSQVGETCHVSDSI
ncbi:hypothetical protein N665_0682s0002 [Sinapis alba]|nr:hypothetical protein N665_0682s0002 [Sinapis alba]